MKWWEKILQSFGALPAPDILPEAAKRELELWSAEDLNAYHEHHGGEAPPDAPTIDEGGI